MIPQLFNGMIAIMLAKFALNDVPHYLFSETTTHRTVRIVPPYKPHKHPAEPVVRVVIVPGGSRWQCVKCGRMLEAGEEVVKVGGKVYCVGCARSGNPGPIASVQGREHVASTHWNEILKYCHTVDDLKKIASGQGTIKVYHGCPTEYAELMIKQGPSVPYKVEDTARYVARVYGIPWIAFYRWAYRRHEVREKLSTATAPVAARWAWSFPLGEVLTDLNSHARMYVAFKALSVREGISLDDAYDKLDKQAIEIAKATGQRYNIESAPDILGLPDKLALKLKTGALIEITVNARIVSDMASHDAKYFLKEIETGELPLKEALLFWNHEYRDFRLDPEDIISMRIVVRNMQPWEQNMIEDMIKEKQLSPYCGVK